METFGCLNGDLTALDELAVPALDHGLTVGDGVFETIPVRNGSPFALDRHLDRLERSAAGLGLAPPDRIAIADSIERVLAANSPDHDRIRVTVTDGVGPPGSDRGDGSGTILVVTSRIGPPAANVDVVITPWSRNPDDALCGLKTTSYAGNVRALAYAAERNAGEGLFRTTDGTICEGSGTNLFAVVDGEIRTPPLTSGCLAGVTRGLVLELTDAIEAPVGEDELRSAPEAFLTSSTRDVQPIARVDGAALGGCPGPHTVAAAEAFADLTATDPNP